MAIKSISVVIPVYNSEAILPKLIQRLGKVLPSLAEDFEVILINDGSRDQSWRVVGELANTIPWVNGIDLMRNYGQHNALLAGIRAAKHEIIITMDDDLQHPPEEIANLLNLLDEGYDVVYGTPEKEQHGFLRNLASRVTKLALQSAMGAKIARNVSAFRAFRAHLRDSFTDYKSPFLSIDVLLTWGTKRFASIPVPHQARMVGESNYTLRKLIIHALNMMTGFSTLPLQIASLMGFALTLFGVGILIFVVGRYLVLGYSVPGFPFLASIIAIFSGAQLFALGVIGEYLARMHFRLMGRPPYAVRSSIKENSLTEGKTDDRADMQLPDYRSAADGSIGE
jgi:undecaprenyl-phosphate 4-deoxy-4-formamido-L-arabinose transferase